jgi:hypothetical protein
MGLSVPIVGLGIATEYTPARNGMLVFAALAVLAIAASVRAVSGRATTPPARDRHHPGATIGLPAAAD